MRFSEKKVSWPILLGVLTLFVSATGALSVIWVRQSVVEVAAQTKIIENKLARAERKYQHFAARIAEVHQPAYLMAKVGKKLHLPNDQQVIVANCTEGHSIAARSKKHLKQPEPFTLSLDLAFLATAGR